MGRKRKIKQHWVAQVFYTNIGRLVISLILSAVFLALSDYVNYNFIYVFYITMLFPMWITLKLFAHAWIINPLKERKRKKKND